MGWDYKINIRETVDGAAMKPGIAVKPSILSRFLDETVRKKPLKKELVGILFDLFRIYAPSGGEKPTVDYCAGVLRQSGFSLIIDELNDNIIASRGKLSTNDKLVCINAHTDTVQRKEDEHVGSLVGYDWVRDAFHTNNRAILGGDDKCGIGVALTLAAYTRLPMKIILTSGEEVGSTGATALEKSYFDDVAFTFTVDRKGANDVITEYCGLTLAPDAFVKKFIELSAAIGLTFKETYGTYADTYILCKYAPAVNLSSGYYNPHSKNEFVLANETYNTMMAIKNAIEHKGELETAITTSPPDWQKDQYALGVYGGYYGGMYGYDGGWYGAVDTRGARGRVRPVTRSRPVRAHYGGTYDYYGKGHNKGIQRKCKIEYEKTRGLDDKELGQKELRDQGIRWSSEELISAYAEGHIQDIEWDHYLMDGVINTAEHRRGIDLRVTRESYKAPTGMPEEFVAEEFGEIETKEFENKSAALAALGFHSGYIGGTVEDMIFVDFVTGELSKSELDEYRVTGTIDEWFYNNCTYARADYVRIQLAEFGAKPTQILQTTGKGVVYGWGETGEESGGEEPTTLPRPTFIPLKVITTGFESKRDEFASRGFKSGHKLGTVEDDVFVEYMSGQMSKLTLWNEVVDGLSGEFAQFCIDSKEEYDELFTTRKGRDIRKREVKGENPTRTMLAKFGLKSGFAAGTEADIIYITYVVGLMSKDDLYRSLVPELAGVDAYAFEQFCIRSKEKYDKLQRIEKISPGSTFIDLSHLVDEPIKPITTGFESKRYRDMLIERGLVSGFNRGTEPDNLFITYVVGLMSESDLVDSAMDVVLHGKIEDFKVSPFKKHCIDAKKIYDTQKRGLIDMSNLTDDCRGA